MQEYIELLRQLVAICPQSTDIGRVNQAMALLRDFLEARGILCTTEEVLGRNLLYASRQPGRRPALLLNMHVDVVPPSEPSQTELVQKDGWLYGRGAFDCLGNAVCAVKALCESEAKASLGIVFSADEEIGGETTRQMVERGYGATRMVCVLDHWDQENIAYAQKGILDVRLTAHGQGGHSSVPWRCDNPLDKLLDGYRRLRESWTNPTEADPWHKSMAATVLEAGQAFNQIPDEASMVLNIRTVAPEEREQILAQLAQTSGLEVTVLEERPPLALDYRNPEVACLAELMERHLGVQPGYTRMNGATDACWFAECGCPVCAFGIKGDHLHAKGERAECESLRKYSELLRELAGRLS